MQESNISRNQFEQCLKCTICTEFCPVVAVNPNYPGPKQAGPDGERLRLKSRFYYDDALKYCMNCKRCETACPSGVRIADIIHSARMKYGRVTPNLRNMILANTDLMGAMARPFAPAVNAVLKTGVAKQAMHSVLGVDKHRTFPEYRKSGFIDWFRKEKEASQGKFKEQVAFFHGCSTEYQHPEVGQALTEVLNSLGVGVQLLDEKCCGVAMVSNGLFGKARKNAGHNLRVFEATSLPIITVSSTCCFTMKEEYEGILGLDNSKVRDRIDLVEKYLCGLIEAGKVKLVFRNDRTARVAYHVPCHLERLGWSIFTKRLLGMVPGLELIELDSNCCGMAGTYGFKKENYGYSQEIGRPLFDQIRALNPDYVACECETCKWQIEMSTGYTVLNPILILAAALDIPATAAANDS